MGNKKRIMNGLELTEMVRHSDTVCTYLTCLLSAYESRACWKFCDICIDPVALPVLSYAVSPLSLYK